MVSDFLVSLACLNKLSTKKYYIQQYIYCFRNETLYMYYKLAIENWLSVH